MKRVITLLLAVLMCLSLCACGDAAKQGEDAAKQEEYEKAMTYLENGKLDKALDIFIELGDYNDSEAMVDTIGAYKDAWELLENGELENAYLAFKEIETFYDVPEILGDFLFLQTSANTYTDGKNTRTEEYEYNKDGSLSVTHGYELKGSSVIQYYELYTYHHEDNSVTVETIYDGETTMEEEYRYDSNGNEIYYKLIVPKQNTNQWWYYYYDDAGNQIKSESYSIYDSSTPFSVRYMEYDEHNQMVRAYYVEDGKVTSESLYENYYDEQGNLIKVVVNGSTTTYEYNADNLLIHEEIHWSWGSTTTYAYEYNVYGNQTRYLAVTGDGTTTEIIYEYAIMYTGDL